MTYRVAYDVAEQALRDMTVAVPRPTTLPEETDLQKVAYGVSKRSVSEGQILKDGDAVCELVIKDPLRIWSTVPERHVSDVKIGQEVRIRVPAHPRRVFLGKVTRINPAIDPLNRTFQVEAAVPNTENLLYPGGFAKVAIITATEAEALTVPIESVVRFAGVTKVFLMVDGKARSVNVTTGQESRPSDDNPGDGWIEVFGEVPADGKVVTSGMALLADGTPLRVRSAMEPDDKTPAASVKP